MQDIEHTCRDLILEHADANKDSVGINVSINHLAPTLPGMTVEITATVSAPVLDAVAAWDAFDVSSAGARAGRGAASVAPMTTPPPVEDAAQAQGNQADG